LKRTAAADVDFEIIREGKTVAYFEIRPEICLEVQNENQGNTSEQPDPGEIIKLCVPNICMYLIQRRSYKHSTAASGNCVIEWSKVDSR
jgi:hypothetical protein